MMRAFSLDLSDLENKLTVKKPDLDIKKVPYANNSSKFTKVAFDMFQSKFDNTIWELAEEDGSKYLVKRTDLTDAGLEATAKKTTKDMWSAAESKNNVVLYLFSVPIRNFPQNQFYDKDSASSFASHLVETVASNTVIAQKYLRTLKNETKKDIAKRCQGNLINDRTRDIYSFLTTEN